MIDHGHTSVLGNNDKETGSMLQTGTRGNLCLYHVRACKECRTVGTREPSEVNIPI